jgi:hypothetical protein
MIMKIELNNTQSFHLGNTVPETVIFSNVIPEILDITIKKISYRTKIKRFITKLSPFHWYDGVWDDLNFDL